MKDIFLFGFYNKCYWLCIMSEDDLSKAMARFTFVNDDTEYFHSLLAQGHTIFVNIKGGFHYGDLAEKKDFIGKGVDEGFPTSEDRIEYLNEKVATMNQEVQNEIDRLCAKLNMTRAEVMEAAESNWQAA